MFKKMRFYALLCLLVLLTGCSSTKPNNSYFGAQINLFRPGPEGGVDRLWTPDHIQSRADLVQALKPFDSIMVAPILVSFSKKEAYDGLNPTELKELADMFRLELSDALRKNYRITTTPGPNTLRLNLAITGIERPNPVLATTSLVLPFGLGISTIKKLATGEHSNVGSASIEGALTDSSTGEVLFAVIDRRAGGKDFAKIVDTSSDAKKAFKWWAERLSTTLQELRTP